MYKNKSETPKINPELTETQRKSLEGWENNLESYDFESLNMPQELKEKIRECLSTIKTMLYGTGFPVEEELLSGLGEQVEAVVKEVVAAIEAEGEEEVRRRKAWNDKLNSKPF